MLVMANQLPIAKRVQILSMLCEGSSMRSISRVVDVSINTVSALLVDAGKVCSKHHDEAVRNVRSKRIQADEIWSFCYAKQKNVAAAKAAPEDAGDVWTWTALDADSKLIVSYLIGGRDAEYANDFMQDVAGSAHQSGATDHGWPPRLSGSRRRGFRCRYRLRDADQALWCSGGRAGPLQPRRMHRH